MATTDSASPPTPQAERFGYDRLGRRNTIKTYLPGTNATWILSLPSPSPVSTLSQSYNDLGEPETESWSGGPLAGRSVTTSRDSFGRRQGVTTSVAGFQAQNVTAYDPAGRPAIITAGSHTATYRYVANSRIRAGVTYRANATQRLDTQYDFDRLNRLQQVLNQPSAAGQPAERHAYTYNAAQQRIRDELADGSSWNWEYDRLGQVIGGRKSWPDGNPVAGQKFEYGFDDIGNRVSQKRGGDANGANLRSTTYVVNPLNQITSRTVVGSRYLDLIGLAEPGTTVTAGGVIASRRGEFWRAELNLGNGNPLWQSVNITTSDGGSLANALYRVPPSSEVPTYDADGNLTADGLWTYTWDAENRLISMQSQALVPAAGRRKLDFEYDPLGRRIGRIVSTGAGGSWVPTSTTRWLYEGWNPVAELNSAGTLVREYVWGTDLSGSWQGAGGVGGLLWVLEAPTVANAAHYVAYDGNGNVMGLVNAADGTWSARYEYGPFGEVIRATGAMAVVNPFRWSTKIQDEDSGLNYYGYRYYSAGVGRWLNRDPIQEFGGLNLYGSLGNDGLNSVDYLGMADTQKRPTEVYCEAAAKYPENKWLQCVCKVSGQINQLAYGLLAEAIRQSGLGDSDEAKRLKAKSDWFFCMNRCMFKRWEAAHKKWEGGTLSEDEMKLINPELEKYCTDCAGRPKAASKNCCEQQVRAEEQGFNDCTNQCGKYDQVNWGPSAGGLTGKVMPGWDPSWDFNDYEKRVEFGLKLCCPNNNKK